MSIVYLAEDARSQSRELAIKIITTEVSTTNNEIDEVALLFQREVSTLTALKHENILPLYDYGVEIKLNERTILAYMVMPFCREGTFNDWLTQRKGRLPLQEVKYFIVQAANTLQYVHSKEIMHRDIKPQNFLIQSNGGDPDRPRLLLSDFGLAKFKTTVTSRNPTIKGGTPVYMAPEQWNGNAVYASDQYALAIIAYELLAANPPFVGSLEEIVLQHFTAQPDPPSVYNPDIPRGLDEVILRALSKQPQDRFDSISAFAKAFEQAAEPHVIVRNLEVPATRATDTPDRNPDPAAVGTALLIAGAAGLAVGAVGLTRHFLKRRKEKKIAAKNTTPAALLPAPRPVALPQELLVNALDYLGDKYIEDCVEEAQISINTDKQWASKLKTCFEWAAIGYVHNVQSAAQETAAQLKPAVRIPRFRPGEPNADVEFEVQDDRPADVVTWIAMLFEQPVEPGRGSLNTEFNARISKAVSAKDPRRETLELIRWTAEKLSASLKAEATNYLLEVDEWLAAS